MSALALPTALGLIPPNGIYGVRTPRAWSSEQGWYSVNRIWSLWTIGLSAAALLVWFALRCRAQRAETNVTNRFVLGYTASLVLTYVTLESFHP